MEKTVLDAKHIDDELLTPEELAARLQVSMKAIRTWASERRIPGLRKVGRLNRFVRSEVERALLRDTFLFKC